MGLHDTLLAGLSGIIPPVLTPFTEQGALDTASLTRLVDFLIDGGVHGLFLLGSSGEFAALTDDERATVLETAIRATRGRVPVLAGILDYSTSRSIQHGLTAKQAGADAVVLSAPFYFNNSQSELLQHFRAVHQAVGLPILAYDIPGTTNVKLGVETLDTLAREGTIAGIKDSSGDDSSFRELIIATRDLPAFRIFTGSELLVDALMMIGAHGAVAGLANVAPGDFVRLYDACQRGDWATARRIQDNLFLLFRIIKQGLDGENSFTASALGGFKSVLVLKGVLATNVVGRPMRRMDRAQVERVAGVIQAYEALSRQ